MTEAFATLAILWGAGMLVLCVAGLIENYRARRRSPFPRASDAPRCVGGPVAFGQTEASMDNAAYQARDRASLARDRAINQVLRDAGYPIDEEQAPRGSRS